MQNTIVFNIINLDTAGTNYYIQELLIYTQTRGTSIHKRTLEGQSTRKQVQEIF